MITKWALVKLSLILMIDITNIKGWAPNMVVLPHFDNGFM